MPLSQTDRPGPRQPPGAPRGSPERRAPGEICRQI